eukprot:c16524_g1_i3.p1 GENE.c16524_g1_i3~~c16524_g1_i3.p1  ORF type:complete len:197 (-),score=61.64 c16524_g1_i3:358-948(-)
MMFQDEEAIEKFKTKNLQFKEGLSDKSLEKKLQFCISSSQKHSFKFIQFLIPPQSEKKSDSDQTVSSFTRNTTDFVIYFFDPYDSKINQSRTEVIQELSLDSKRFILCEVTNPENPESSKFVPEVLLEIPKIKILPQKSIGFEELCTHIEKYISQISQNNLTFLQKDLNSVEQRINQILKDEEKKKLIIKKNYYLL